MMVLSSSMKQTHGKVVPVGSPRNASRDVGETEQLLIRIDASPTDGVYSTYIHWKRGYTVYNIAWSSYCVAPMSTIEVSLFGSMCMYDWQYTGHPLRGALLWESMTSSSNPHFQY